ncbi:DUF5085 family protein [Macrococcoides canis]|uniref:DUF5085 family protein n=1 Tax=Macrococcoides canis TaxID=1855823 RepID=UPI0020B7F360|nr:DUF5085 family protein [Macrococcus canis]UTG99569.1 DUF5085 family protein [Macrococcus canis]
MEKSAIIQPNCAVYEFIDSNQSWMEELQDVYHHFILEDAFLVGPIIFTKEPYGIGEEKVTVYLPLNDEIEPIESLNLRFEPLLTVIPTLSEKCFEEDEFEIIYEAIRLVCKENNLKLADKPFYHTMADYMGGYVYEVHGQIDVSEL